MKTEKEMKNEARRKLYSMILPITIENLLQMSAGFVSMAMIGRIDAVSIGALGISTRITQILWALFKGIATGSTVYVAQSYGAGNYKKLRAVAGQTLLSAVVLIIILQQIVYWNSSPFLRVFNPQPEMLNSSIIYLKTVSWGLPFLVIMLVTAGVLQGMGNARTPMMIALLMNIVNIVLSYVFIFGKLGIAPMGLKGAALALAISQFTGASAGLFVLFKRDGVLGKLFNKSFFTVDMEQIKAIYNIGLPTSFESIFWQMAAVILTRVILSFGETAFASYQLGLQAEAISYMPAMGFGIAATAFIGQCLGARDKKMGKIYFKEIITGAMLLTGASTLVLLFLPQPFMRLLTNDESIIKLGVVYLVLMGFVQIPYCISVVLNGTLRAAGYARVPMVVAGIGLWGIRIPLSLGMTYYFKTDVVTIWIVMCIDLIIRFIISIIIYKSKDIYNTTLISCDNPKTLSVES